MLRGCDGSDVSLISQFISAVSLLTQVNTAGDPRHVVTLVGMMVKTADPEEDIRGQ